MSKQEEQFASEMRELWEDYGSIGEEFFELARAVESYGEVGEKEMNAARALLSKSIDISMRIQLLLMSKKEGKS